jgi:hypothetical protein
MPNVAATTVTATVTVFLDVPSGRAISEIETRSDRYNLRISAQCSAPNTRSFGLD